MAQTIEQPAMTSPPPREGERQKRTRAVVRKVGPWSVLKFSLLFYTCVMLVILLALSMLYSIMDAAGILDTIGELLAGVGLGTCVEAADGSESVCTFTFDGGWLFSRAFFLGLAGVLIWSLINVFVAFLYNLISDVVGGIEITLSEKR